MKTKIVTLLLIQVAAVACGKAPDIAALQGAATESTVVAPQTPNTYTYRLQGIGITFSADLYGNPGEVDQNNTPVNHYTINDGNPVDVDITGYSTLGNITYNAGAGVLTITLLKNGVAAETRTITNPGLATSFTLDI